MSIYSNIYAVQANNNNNYGDEGLDPYMVQRIIKGSSKYQRKIYIDVLLSEIEIKTGNYYSRKELMDTLQLLHDYGFGIRYNSKTVFYDYDLDFAA